MRQYTDNLFLIDSLGECPALWSSMFKGKHMLIFMTGMMQDEEELTQLVNTTRLVFDNHPDWNVVVVNNQSHGAISDLLECAIGKLCGTLFGLLFEDAPEYPARVLTSILESRDGHKKTVVFGHSQGGILACNGIDCANKYIQHNLDIALFGSANWFLYPLNKSQVVSVTTKYDVVSHLFGRGFLLSTYKISSSKYHKLSGYLPAIELSMRYYTEEISNDQFLGNLPNV